MLAERAGIQLKPQRSGGKDDEKRTLYQAMAWLRSSFITAWCRPRKPNLPDDIWPERKISTESIHRYHLGFALDRWDWLLKQALNTEISVKALETVGLIDASKTDPVTTIVFAVVCCFRFTICRVALSRLAVVFCRSWRPTTRPSMSIRQRCRCSRRAVCSTARHGPRCHRPEQSCRSHGRLHRHHHRATVWI